ncbi:alpha/beta fold hydrolase [Cellulomonas cellasea]|uniref:Uncharacterized protein n=2 Tax=Cellulomonas cellasea TaxID=43670 RepID=A0A0A0BEE6_9CELL|nr:hypothetical protein [Cellulomonas cellasea]KGM03721.1 hypothetical protein Q760_14825 [Cellulomonas cellasea DSM 20118]GEA86926.1 hypothetical protein CCE01nite_08750 [Cellulomonas cellasea]
MPVLVRDGLRLAYEITGGGAPLLLPLCNFRWTDAVVERLARSFTVVIASPRGFAGSDRLSLARASGGSVAARLDNVLPGRDAALRPGGPAPR